jgi:hypothetical protein
MQDEEIEFTFRLGIVAVYNPLPVQFLLNDTVVREVSLDTNSGIVKFSSKLKERQGYCLKLQVLELPRQAAIYINNINISWPIDLHSHRYFNPAYRSRSPNELWHYSDADAGRKNEMYAKNSQNIDLDYVVNNVPGYLKKFGRFESTSGEIVNFSNQNKPFRIGCPGTFKIDFTSPISYWLYKNLI